MEELLFSVNRDGFEFQYFRVSGAGGQHRDKTSNGCRCIHKETGIMATCTENRSQSENRRQAWVKVVTSKEFRNWVRKKVHICCEAKTCSEERIRTYNLSDNRITDHRTGVTTTKVKEVMDGGLDLLYGEPGT